MAQKIQTLFIDDLDGSEAEATIRFALDDIEYEIDLNTEHAQALRMRWRATCMLPEGLEAVRDGQPAARAGHRRVVWTTPRSARGLRRREST